MEYDSSTIQESQPPLITRLIFSRLLEFAWSEFDRGVRLGDHEVEFSLIEITDSPLIAEINRRVREQALDERTLRHYRIAFDDHGIVVLAPNRQQLFTGPALPAIPGSCRRRRASRSRW